MEGVLCTSGKAWATREDDTRGSNCGKSESEKVRDIREEYKKRDSKELQRKLWFKEGIENC